jgi:aspartate aminotransferase
VQTISGTGAVHIAFMLLARSVPNMSKTVYVGTPAWGNYVPMLGLAGLDAKTYTHYDPKTGTVDWDSVLATVRSAPEGSIFVLQACCHNPTAADFTKEQWQILAQEMKTRRQFPIFDIAYQGLGNGLEEDIYCVRHFVEQGFEMLVCQSFAKNFALYGERVGALHAVCPSADSALAVRDQMRFLIRVEFSSSPAYGSRLVDLILSDPAREAAW